jgi:DNA-binding SARP family transcriptional activator
MPSLDNILNEIRAMLDVPDDELTEEQRTVMDAYLNGLGQAEADKVDAIGQFLKLETGHIDNLKQEATRLTNKAKAVESRLNRLKAYYMASMTRAGIKKIQGASYCMSLRESVSVSVTSNIDTLPPEYVRETVKREADKVTIREHLKAGVQIEGCELVKNTSLQVK